MRVTFTFPNNQQTVYEFEGVVHKIYGIKKGSRRPILASIETQEKHVATEDMEKLTKSILSIMHPYHSIVVVDNNVVFSKSKEV